MQYAVIRSGGKQYKVSVGDTLSVDKISDDPGKSVVFDEVLLFVDGEKVNVGNPTLKGAKVSAKFVENKKGDKIRVMKFKAKSRYRRTTGFRAQLSVVQIEKIDFGVKSAKTLA